MQVLRGLGCGLALFALPPLTRAAAPLDCPSGTYLASGQRMPDGGTEDFCVDNATGLPEGPMRQYRPDGSLLGEGTNRAGKIEGVVRLYAPDGTPTGEAHFEQGEARSMNMTAAGLQEIVDELNAGYAASNESQRLTVIDERTVGLAVKIDQETKFSPSEQTQIREAMRHNADVCSMFTVMGISVLKMQFQSLKGVDVGDVSLTAAECGAAQPAH